MRIDKTRIAFLIFIGCIVLIICGILYSMHLRHLAILEATWVVKGKISNVEYIPKGLHGYIWRDSTRVVFFSGEEIEFLGYMIDDLPIGHQVKIEYKKVTTSIWGSLFLIYRYEIVNVEITDE